MNVYKLKKLRKRSDLALVLLSYLSYMYFSLKSCSSRHSLKYLKEWLIKWKYVPLPMDQHKSRKIAEKLTFCPVTQPYLT